MPDTRAPEPLPALPNLEHQRKRARALLKAARAQDRDALRRFRALSSRSGGLPVLPSLHAAQLVIAREYGFASWAKLKTHIEACELSPLGSLALLDAANRALETERAEPLYRDPFARALAGEAGAALLERMRSAWGAASGPQPSREPQPYLSIRTRFFDDALRHAVRAAGLGQVVVLGAGMDSRAFRLEWPNGLAWFELDRAEILERKERVLREFPRPHPARRVIDADLRGDWAKELLTAGFRADRPTAFLLEGVLLYLRPEAVGHVLGTLRGVASPGSRLLLDVIGAATVASPFMSAHLKKLADLGRPNWEFGVDDPEAFLATHGWRATSVIAGEPRANFGRWLHGHAPRDFLGPGVPRAFFVEGARE